VRLAAGLPGREGALGNALCHTRFHSPQNRLIAEGIPRHICKGR
jgi:hypothetical protein